MLSQPEACALLSGCPFGSRGHPRTCSGQDSLLTCAPTPSPTGQGDSGGRGCARVRVCTTGAGVESTDTSSNSGLWSAGRPRQCLIVCCVCPLCGFVSDIVPAPLGVWVWSVCLSLAEVGEGPVHPPVCARDSVTTTPLTAGEGPRLQAIL